MVVVVVVLVLVIGIINSILMSILSGRLSDTWVYNASSELSNKWVHVTGSMVRDERIAGSLEPRESTAQWRDVTDNCLYVFGGWGRNVTGGTVGRCE